ncbi:MAG TPA: hypothetical protein VLM37_05560, partial [Fibrobacteraceae bacterium]|nr:hypothetical protein [Fibrobacteraceae bacterium]
MSLNDLYNLLNNAIHDNQITLNADLSPDLAVVLQALNVPSLLVNQPRLSQSLSAVTLEGSASYRNNNCKATLVGTLSGSDYAFTLKLAVETTDVWTFRSAFENIPDTYTLQGITLQPSDSYLYETQITQPAFIASNPPPAAQGSQSASNLPAIQFTGLLNMTGPLAPYADYLGNGPFPLQGTILILNPDFPLFQLRAVVAGKSINITSTSIGQIAIRLRTGTYPETATTNVNASTLELAGSVDIGSTTPVVLEVAAQLLQGDIRWILQGNFDDYTEQLQGGLEQLASFLDVPLVNLLAPPAVKALSSFYLKDIRVSLIPPNSAQLLPQLDSLSGTVMTHDDWIPPIPFIKVSQVGARWLVNFSDSTPVVSGCVFGTVTFGKSPNEVPFFINATLPDFRLQCSLNTGYEFDLGEVLGWFYGGTGPSTGLTVTDLNFVADPTNQSFQFQADATTTYAITFGNLTFTLADVG